MVEVLIVICSLVAKRCHQNYQLKIMLLSISAYLVLLEIIYPGKSKFREMFGNRSTQR